MYLAVMWFQTFFFTFFPKFLYLLSEGSTVSNPRDWFLELDELKQNFLNADKTTTFFLLSLFKVGAQNVDSPFV